MATGIEFPFLFASFFRSASFLSSRFILSFSLRDIFFGEVAEVEFMVGSVVLVAASADEVISGASPIRAEIMSVAIFLDMFTER